MKTLVYICMPRHEGRLLDNGILEQFRLMLLGGHLQHYHFTDVFYAPLADSIQTALHAATCLLPSNFNRHLVTAHAPIQEVGNEDFFERVTVPAYKEAMNAGASSIEALELAHPPEMMADCEIFAGRGVEKMFAKMKNDAGLCPGGYDPIITLAARQFGWRNTPILNEFEYLTFVQDGNGLIRVEI